MSSDPPEPFRLRNENDPQGSISVAKFLRASVNHGEFHFMFLVPHVIIPVYGVYRLLCQWGLWPVGLVPLGELILALIQGAAMGGAVVFGYLRWSAPGRALKGRRNAGLASPGETRAQKKIQLGFALSCYVLFATVIWVALPVADGPTKTALKQKARRWGFEPNSL